VLPFVIARKGQFIGRPDRRLSGVLRGALRHILAGLPSHHTECPPAGLPPCFSARMISRSAT